MSKWKICSVVVLTAVLAGAAFAAPGRGGGGGGGRGGGGAHFGGGGAHFGGGARMGGAHFGGGARIGGGPRFSGRVGVSRSAARPSFHQRSSAPRSTANRLAVHGPASRANRASRVSGNPTLRSNRNASVRSNAVRHALGAGAVAGALHNRAALRNPNTRAQITASAAMAGWHDGRGRGGWWRHRNGGYGWVGPLFWPFAYYDIYDYAMWGYGYDDPFWDYGYGDIYAGLFSPYGYDDLAGYLPQGAGGPQASIQQPSGTSAQAATSDQLAQMCGEDSRDIAGLPIDQIQQAITPNDAQRAALDDLANASVKAAQDIRAACPTQIALTAPARLAAMQQRIEAMIAAVKTVQPPLQKFYDLLSDEQKARLNALGEDQHRADAANKKSGSLTANCGAAQSGVLGWPSAQIDSRLHPTETQRTSLAALQDATAKAEDMLKSSCQATEAITPPARLAAVGERLDVMLQAVKSVRTALDDFYGKLSDEQKAQFEAIGRRHTALLTEPPTVAQTHGRRHHYHGVNVAGLIRHFMWLAR
jgi:hypothetical protein